MESVSSGSMSTSGGTPGRGDKCVTVIIDLTPVRDGSGPARLLDMVEGRSKQVFKTWLAERDETWRTAVDVVAMDGFTRVHDRRGGGTQDDVVVVMDPCHVVRFGRGTALSCVGAGSSSPPGVTGAAPETRCIRLVAP